MKERISSIDNEDYHRIVYPSICAGDNVLQKTLDGDYLVLPNPERLQPVREHQPVIKGEPVIIRTRGIQAALHPLTTQRITHQSPIIK